MIDKIKIWLESEQDYSEGYELYLKAKTNNDLDSFLLANKDAQCGSLAHGLLNKELMRLYRIALQQVDDGVYEQPAPVAPTVHVKAQRTVLPTIETDIAQVNYSDLPDNLKVDYDRVKELSRALGGYKSALDAATTDAERKEYADLIVVAIDERKQLWDGIDEFVSQNAPQKASTKKKK